MIVDVIDSQKIHFLTFDLLLSTFVAPPKLHIYIGT